MVYSTVSNSKLVSHVSPGIEPWVSNIFTEQTSKGTFIRKNGELIKVLRKGESIIKILGIKLWKMVVRFKESKN